ncbi:hypothetical protein M0R45_022709 [Rubus argutus]|uniref:Uncharacterized protein n=1 Tax=Rubus argutus TaxID=59490 RepID=A0AAW1XGH5_RUBAR
MLRKAADAIDDRIKSKVGGFLLECDLRTKESHCKDENGGERGSEMLGLRWRSCWLGGLEDPRGTAALIWALSGGGSSGTVQRTHRS